MRKTLYLLCIALLASTAAMAWMWRELAAERRHAAELGARLVELSTQRPPVVSASAQAVMPAQPPPSPAEPAVTPAADRAKVSGPGKHELQDWQSQQRRLMQDPRYVEEIRRQRRMLLAPRRDDAIRLLGLSPQQADAAIELWVERELVEDQARLQNPTQQGPAQREAADRAYEAALQKLLGQRQAE